MTYFTDNPFERMMQQKPQGGSKSRPAKLPPSHRCYGCTHYGGCNTGHCYRSLIVKTKKRKDGR